MFLGFFYYLDIKASRNGTFVLTREREIKGEVVWVKGEKGNPHLLQAQKALDYLFGGRGTRLTLSTKDND